MEGYNGMFKHDEADITMISYLQMAAESGTQVVRILSDDTDVFVLLVYWVYKHKIQATVQMLRWDGSVWDINATCAQLGSKCLQIQEMHYLTGLDATSYFPGLCSVLGEVDATHAQLKEAGQSLFCALYCQPQGTPMSELGYNMYIRKHGKPLKVMSLPPIDQNPLLALAHLTCPSVGHTCQSC